MAGSDFSLNQKECLELCAPQTMRITASSYSTVVAANAEHEKVQF